MNTQMNVKISVHVQNEIRRIAKETGEKVSQVTERLLRQALGIEG